MPLRGLTAEQLDAVTHDGNLLLTACPGAGKTKTLVSKIAYQLNQQQGRQKRRLVALTYTNVAAETILERLDAYGIDSNNLWVGTIHSFCLEWVIKPYVGYSSRISKGYRIIDEYEQRKIINKVKSQFKIGIFDDLPTQLNECFEVQSKRNTSIFNAVTEYHNILLENKLIDFDLILTISLSLLTQYNVIGERLASLFSSIMVDEFQDTNQIQYSILKFILSHKSTEVTFIGDIDQAIYTGLGAVVKDKVQIELELGIAPVTEKTLSGCFRSTQTIIDYYSTYQDHSINILSLAPHPPSASAVRYDADVHRDDLGTFIGKIIDRHIINGVPTNEIVVIAPQWTDVIKLGGLLRKSKPNLDFNAPGISPISKSQDNPWVYLIRLFFSPISGKTYSKRQRLASYLTEGLGGMGFTFWNNKDSNKLILTSVNKLVPYSDGSVEEFIESIITEFSDLISLNIDAYSQILDSKNALIESTSQRINQFNIINDASTLSSYFSEMRGIDVTSCHSTKGEEYDVVIATGLVRGKLPHWNDIIGKEQDHTDYMARRLLYVISSRARKYLYLISEKGHTTRRGDALIPTPQL